MKALIAVLMLSAISLPCFASSFEDLELVVWRYPFKWHMISRDGRQVEIPANQAVEFRILKLTDEEHETHD